MRLQDWRRGPRRGGMGRNEATVQIEWQGMRRGVIQCSIKRVCDWSEGVSECLRRMLGVNEGVK